MNNNTVSNIGLKEFVFFFATLVLVRPIIAAPNLTSGNIEILLSSDNSIYEQALYGIQSTLDHPAKVSYVDLIQSENKDISSYFRELEATNTKLLIAIGPIALKLAGENITKIPVIFTMVSNPKSFGFNSGNICGVGMDISIAEFFKTIKELSPNAEKVITFYSQPEGEFFATEGDYVDLKYKLLFSKRKVSEENFRSNLEKIKGEYDAFIIIKDPLYNRSVFEELSSFAQKNKIILGAPFPALVRAGTTFGISPEYNKLGIETGDLANRILSEKSSCKTEKFILPDKPAFFLNETYAAESGLNVPIEIKERAKLTQLFAVGINLLNEGKLKSARVIFETILKKDPNNQSVSSYLQLVIEKMTGGKTKELLQSADEYYKKGNYSQSRAEYQKVLFINPNLQVARDGLATATFAQSEAERISAEHLARNGKVFDAIKMYLSSLRTYPQNSKSSGELNHIRVSEFSKISEYLKEGINLYSQREYENSIRIFEHILLIDPLDKRAQEYLRLSNKKKEAIQILQAKRAN
ncbi:oligopeptide ABC transporter, oligopeptide-binding protein [Leptospira fainei serovar Hurstbridge str. BUT 6]|uniref:Oligopeptide ABC transporter, oligopeptide-binding protein n=1 Tax=Leptospira fainei serovar Hurstbridge str. BUT 6 TaxID=1193011 RepID=S3V1F2_9LEPT|nr:ABC transporter substrate binding protein [Leptospira fainei]EPG76491.1 oligopeptide ABC transporter, oligopeptide-binding protein [Leptospira fainei serovar Hurstbridge str. BUT 6]